MQLTPQARAIIARFEKLEKDVEELLQVADQDFKKLILKCGEFVFILSFIGI